MPRILGVDDDALARAVLADLLIGLGHEAVPAASAAEAMALLHQRRFDLVITDILMPDVDGFELAQRIAALPEPVPVVLASGFYRGDAEAQARAAGIPVVGFLPKPVDPEKLAAIVNPVIGRAARPGRPVEPPRREAWTGADFLADVHGPVERVPPLRVLFLAHRVGATGAIHIDHPSMQGRIVLRAGRILHVEGLPHLLRSLDARLPDHRHLGRDVGEAIAAGHDPQKAMEAAAEGIGEQLARLLTLRGGEVRFEAAATPPPGAFPLPAAIPRVIAHGVRIARPPAQVASQWESLAGATVRLRVPDDSAEDRWGLDPAAMRVIRLASNARDVGQLLRDGGGADPDRRVEVVRALDLLYMLGVVVVDGGPLDTAGEPEGEIVRRQRQTEEDPRVVRLRNALTVMEGLSPVDILELGDRRNLAEDDVATGFREVSRRFHPDQFFGAPPIVRALAEACFTKVNAAYEQMRMPGAREEARKLLEARAAGRRYVSDRDGQQARLAFRRGEVLFRNRDWRGADTLFLEAVNLDPQTWPHGLYAARTGYLTRRLSAADALTQLDALEAPEAARRADVLVAMGSIHKVEGREEEAHRHFKEALERNPDNRDAQREVRLFENRVAARKPPEGSVGLLQSLMRKK